MNEVQEAALDAIEAVLGPRPRRGSAFEYEQWNSSDEEYPVFLAYMGLSTIRTEIERLRRALREVVNVLGPEYFSGEIEGLVAEGNEALRVARAALS